MSDSRAMWRQRFKLARPHASDKDIERAIDGVLRDPTGAYANEIRTTAAHRALDRQETESEYVLLANHHRQCEKAGIRLAVVAKALVESVNMDNVGDFHILQLASQVAEAVEAWDAHQWPELDS